MVSTEEEPVQFVQVNGVSLHHQIIGGPGNKPVIVFINSLGTDFRIWRDVIVRLRGTFRCIAPDYPGFGLSRPAAGSSSAISLGSVASARAISRRRWSP